VAGTSLRDFDEVAELRLVLEPLGVRLATPHLSPADLEVLRGQVERMEALLTAGDISGFARVDAQFHQYLYDRCPNRRLAEILTSLRTAAERNTVLFRRLPDHVAKSQDEHRALLAALMNHDAAAAEAAARRHRCGVTARLRSALSGEGGGAPD
jgi:DNA-binding GntR family transcriptional regulator